MLLLTFLHHSTLDLIKIESCPLPIMKNCISIYSPLMLSVSIVTLSI